MKKFLLALSLFLMLLASFSGCGNQASLTDGGKKDGKLKVVTTVFPLYDWTRQIAGDEIKHMDLTLLLSNGVDLHSYQPTSSDIMKISNADLFIYVGGESDEWVKDVLKEATNKNMIAVNLMEVLGDKAKREELVEGMEKEDDGEEEDEYDEHIWLSLKNANILCRAIADALERADAAHADAYRKNADAYLEKLAALDKEYRDTVAQAKGKTLVFGDRFPFRYLADDYGLAYYAAFAGCSAETEASFETIAFLSGKVNELKPPAILVLEGRTHKIAEAVAQNSSLPQTEILPMDSMQGTSKEDAEKGATYLSIMEKNLVILKNVLQ